jgi:hypothetical protein
MNDTATTEDTGHPDSCHEPMSSKPLIWTLVVGLHQGQRTSWPHRKAGHMTEGRQVARQSKNACQWGPSTYDSRTLRSTPESGPRAGYDGAKRKRGSKLHLAVDTLGHLLALHVTPANVDDRAEVGRLAEAIQEATGESVTLA